MSFGTAYHFIFLDWGYLDRSAQGLKPKFVKLSAPSDADIAAVVAKPSQRVLHKLRGAITPPPRQPGIAAAACLASSRWGWADLLKIGVHPRGIEPWNPVDKTWGDT